MTNRDLSGFQNLTGLIRVLITLSRLPAEIGSKAIKVKEIVVKKLNKISAFADSKHFREGGRLMK